MLVTVTCPDWGMTVWPGRAAPELLISDRRNLELSRPALLGGEAGNHEGHEEHEGEKRPAGDLRELRVLRGYGFLQLKFPASLVVPLPL